MFKVMVVITIISVLIASKAVADRDLLAEMINLSGKIREFRDQADIDRFMELHNQAVNRGMFVK